VRNVLPKETAELLIQKIEEEYKWAKLRHPTFC
jgi:hypothetical protein